MTLLPQDAPVVILRPVNDGTGHYAAYTSARHRKPVDSVTSPAEPLAREWNRRGYRVRLRPAFPTTSARTTP